MRDFIQWLENNDITDVQVPQTNLQPQADSDQMTSEDYDKIVLLNNNIQEVQRTIKSLSQSEMSSNHAKQLLQYAHNFTRTWSKLIAYTGDKGLGDS